MDDAVASIDDALSLDESARSCGVPPRGLGCIEMRKLYPPIRRLPEKRLVLYPIAAIEVRANIPTLDAWHMDVSADHSVTSMASSQIDHVSLKCIDVLQDALASHLPMHRPMTNPRSAVLTNRSRRKGLHEMPGLHQRRIESASQVSNQIASRRYAAIEHVAMQHQETATI